MVPGGHHARARRRQGVQRTRSTSARAGGAARFRRRAFRPSTRRANGATRRLAVDNYGSKWVWIEDKRLPRSDAWLAAEDVDVGDHDSRRGGDRAVRGRARRGHDAQPRARDARREGRRRRRHGPLAVPPAAAAPLLCALGARRRAVQLGLRVLRRRQPRPSDERSPPGQRQRRAVAA